MYRSYPYIYTNPFRKVKRTLCYQNVILNGYKIGQSPPKYWKNIIGGECVPMPPGIIKTGVARGDSKAYLFHSLRFLYEKNHRRCERAKRASAFLIRLCWLTRRGLCWGAVCRGVCLSVGLYDYRTPGAVF